MWGLTLFLVYKFTNKAQKNTIIVLTEMNPNPRKFLYSHTKNLENPTTNITRNPKKITQETTQIFQKIPQSKSTRKLIWNPPLIEHNNHNREKRRAMKKKQQPMWRLIITHNIKISFYFSHYRVDPNNGLCYRLWLKRSLCFVYFTKILES